MPKEELIKQDAEINENIKKADVCEQVHESDGIKEVMVPMKDGVKLRTVICFPKGNGPWPTLFLRTPYPFFDTYGRKEGEEYVKRGYVYVFQFCRGTCGSEGKWVPNENEREDGIESINWVARQEWSKSIGIHGASYMALTGWIISDCLPEKVKALYLCHYSVDRYLSAYKGGLFRHDVLTGWAMGNAGKVITSDYIESALYRPHIHVDEELWGIKLDWYREWITNTDYDCEYWQTGVWKTLREIPEKIKIPACVVAGWYDHHLEGSILGYEKLNNNTKSHSKLVIGGWNHEMEPCVPAHNPQNAAIDKFSHMLGWFDRILIEEKQPDTGIETYIIGDDCWHKWDVWPIENTGKASINLTAQKRSDCSAYMLSPQAPDKMGIIEYDYNPENPVYTHGGETLLVSVKERGSLLQEEPGYRKDVISFVSDPLTENIFIAGKMNSKLFVSSDCEDSCFTARIMEVLPNGEAYNIRSSITTLAYRNNSRSRIVYNPGNIVEVNIDLLPVTWNIKIGSRIRVDISSSSFPEYAIHSNYPGIWSLQDKVKTAHQKIYCGGEYPSRIEIPVIK